jgi:uncharacterized protein with GYD domain
MPHYVVLGSWTEQGIRSTKDTPNRAEAYRKTVEAMGGKVTALLFTMGTYDFVTILDLPSDEAANELLLKTAAQGNIRTVTLKGWTESEFAKLAAKL